MNWFMDNIHWLLSGIAVALPIAIISWLLARRHFRLVQKQTSGDESVNIQVGRDMSIDQQEADHEA